MKSKIEKKLPGVKTGISLSSFTTFKIGGECDFLFEAKTDEELIRALEVVVEEDIPYLILGGGSNVLISDEGFPGLVILTSNSYIRENLRVGSGTVLMDLVEYSIENSLAGLEEVAGIPGAVGGAIRGNAGAYSCWMEDLVVEVEAFNLETGQVETLSNEECQFSHKWSVFKEKDLIIISAVFSLEKGGDPKRVEEIVKNRESKLPLEYPSAGCMFQNYKGEIHVEGFPLLEKFNKKGVVPTGYLIDKAGLKGKRIGGAQISEKHANFIINKDGATAEDVAQLAGLAQQKVKKVFGVDIKKEVQFI